MYVIEKTADGHSWDECSHSEQPINGGFTKMYCIYCGAKAYTVGEDRVSLTGEYYSGEITQCPMLGKEPIIRLKRRPLKLKRKKLSRIKRKK